MPPLRPTAIAVYVYRFTQGGWEFLQLRRTSAAYGQTWQTVYGGVEDGETAIAAAIRELKEETGLVPRRMFQVEYLESFYFRANDSITLMPVFAVEVNQSDAITLNAEHDDFRWVHESEVNRVFMWRTQREVIRILFETMHEGGPAMKALMIDV